MFYKTFSKLLFWVGYIIFGALILFFRKQLFLNPQMGYFLALLFIPVYWGIFKLLVALKEYRCNSIISELSKSDKAWNNDKIESEARHTIEQLIRAKVERNPEYMEQYMTPETYGKFKKSVERMKREGRINKIENFRIMEINPVCLDDIKGDSKDKVSVCVQYEAVDYTVDEPSGLLLSGNCQNNKTFDEIWTFARTPQRWILEDIEGSATIGELLSSCNVVEES